jgi:hypothetical protein
MMLRTLSTIASALLFFSVAMVQTASAATIAIKTGVNGAGTPLGENVVDPFWTISVQGGGFVAAEIVNSEVVCCGMETVGSQAAWISDPSVTDGSPFTGWGVGPVTVARRTFDLSGFDLTQTAMSGTWRVADSRRGIYLNGNLIAANTADGGSGWTTDQAFSVLIGSAFFSPGLNTIELRGSSVNSQFDGFWLDATIRTEAAVATAPEPALLSLLGLALVGLNSGRMRRVF